MNHYTGIFLGRVAALGPDGVRPDMTQSNLDVENYISGSPFGELLALDPHISHPDMPQPFPGQSNYNRALASQQWAPGNFEITSTYGLNNNNKGTDNDGEEVDAYSGMNNEPESGYDNPAAATSHAPLFPMNGSHRRRMMYGLQPQSDPETEKRRRRAVRQRHHRHQNEEEKGQQIQKKIHERERTVEELSREVDQLRQEAQMLLKQKVF